MFHASHYISNFILHVMNLLSFSLPGHYRIGPHCIQTIILKLNLFSIRTAISYFNAHTFVTSFMFARDIF